MSLLNFYERKLQYVMYVYCRESEQKLCIKIPKEIKAIIYLFGKFYFKWKHGPDSNGVRYTFYKTHRKWSLLAVNDCILSSNESP